MYLEIFLFGIIVAALAVIVFLIFFLRKPYKWKKWIKGDRTVFVFEAGKDLKGIELHVRQGKEEMTFKRKNLKKGETVEFVYPVSTELATLMVDDDGGRKSHEV